MLTYKKLYTLNVLCVYFYIHLSLSFASSTYINICYNWDSLCVQLIYIILSFPNLLLILVHTSLCEILFFVFSTVLLIVCYHIYDQHSYTFKKIHVYLFWYSLTYVWLRLHKKKETHFVFLFNMCRHGQLSIFYSLSFWLCVRFLYCSYSCNLYFFATVYLPSSM